MGDRSSQLLAVRPEAESLPAFLHGARSSSVARGQRRYREDPVRIRETHRAARLKTAEGREEVGLSK